jgi:hypothetical protein
MAPYAEVLPDRRYAKTLMALVPGMLAAQTPQISGAAAQAPGRAASSWPLAKCGYSLMKTPRFSHEWWLQVLYDDARRTAQAAQVERVIVALDPVNFEQAYMEKLEGGSVIWKSTPPGTLPQRQKRLTPGYPALLAYTTNLPQPAVPYARWFSYTEKGFRSENMEIFQALERISQVLAGFQVCIVADAGLDDRKFYDRCRYHELQFIVRAARDRLIDIFNPRLQRWEREHLVEIVSSMPGHVTFHTAFIHAGKTRWAQVTLDWFRFRIPDSDQDLWGVVAETEGFNDPLVLITNCPAENTAAAQSIYHEWRQRAGIEHFYRFIQEDGLDIEEIQLQYLERQRRSFVLVLALALFVLRLPRIWSPAMILWLRSLGSSTTGTAMDRGGPYALLRGLQAVLSALAVLSSLASLLPRQHAPPLTSSQPT